MTSNNTTVAHVQAAVLAVSSGKEVNEDEWMRSIMRFPFGLDRLYSA